MAWGSRKGQMNLPYLRLKAMTLGQGRTPERRPNLHGVLSWSPLGPESRGTEGQGCWKLVTNHGFGPRQGSQSACIH